MKITHATEPIQQPIKIKVLCMAKNYFGHCWQGSILGQGYFPGNNPQDDIDMLKKPHNFHISH